VKSLYWQFSAEAGYLNLAQRPASARTPLNTGPDCRYSPKARFADNSLLLETELVIAPKPADPAGSEEVFLIFPIARLIEALIRAQQRGRVQLRVIDGCQIATPFVPGKEWCA